MVITVTITVLLKRKLNSELIKYNQIDNGSMADIDFNEVANEMLNGTVSDSALSSPSSPALSSHTTSPTIKELQVLPSDSPAQLSLPPVSNEHDSALHSHSHAITFSSTVPATYSYAPHSQSNYSPHHGTQSRHDAAATEQLIPKQPHSALKHLKSTHYAHSHSSCNLDHSIASELENPSERDAFLTHVQ